jgi:hypothetical protein
MPGMEARRDLPQQGTTCNTMQITATDQTSRAIHFQRLEAEAKKAFRPVKLPRRSR